MKTRLVVWSGVRLRLSWLLIGVLASAGCGTPAEGDHRVIGISLMSDGRALLAGQVMPVKQVPGRLKQMGAESETRLRVSLPRHTPRATVHEMTSVLTAAGYFKVAFVRPRRAVSFSDPESAQPARD